MSFLIPPNDAQFECIKKDDAYRPPAELEEDITQLIEWMSKQPHLPNVTGKSKFVKKNSSKKVLEIEETQCHQTCFSSFLDNLTPNITAFYKTFFAFFWGTIRWIFSKNLTVDGKFFFTQHVEQ